MFPAVTFVLLHYRHLEKVKITGLKYHYNNFDKKADISDEEETKIQWWIDNIDNSCHHIITKNSNIKIYIDASLTE